MRVAIVDDSDGRILGELSVDCEHGAFFFSDAFDAWRNEVMALAVTRAMERCDSGCFYQSRFHVRVSR